jgi:hypothetical protein
MSCLFTSFGQFFKPGLFIYFFDRKMRGSINLCVLKYINLFYYDITGMKNMLLISLYDLYVTRYASQTA